jgi:hypothetical protein
MIYGKAGSWDQTSFSFPISNTSAVLLSHNSRKRPSQLKIMTTAYVGTEQGPSPGNFVLPNKDELCDPMADDSSSTSSISSYGEEDGDIDEMDDDNSDYSGGSDESSHSMVDEIEERIEAFARVGSTPILAQMVFDFENFKLPPKNERRRTGTSSVTSLRSKPSAPAPLPDQPSSEGGMFTIGQLTSMLLSTRGPIATPDPSSLNRSMSAFDFQSLPYETVRQSSGSVSSASTRQQDPSLDVKPWDFLGSLMKTQGIKLASFSYSDMEDDFFLPLEPKHFATYDNEIAQATRSGDLQALRTRYGRGGSILACNKFKETTIHTICRRGHAHMLRFILEETDIPVQLVDDIGRNPLHDACWTHKPNFDLIKQLIEKCPDLLYISDNRGFTPLAYIGKPCWRQWCKFLQNNQDILAPRELLVEPCDDASY